jgi:cytochrome c oxidase subunit 4
MKAREPSRKALFQVWAALLALLLLTWGVANINLGAWNSIAAMSIAVIKMLLVVLVFMQLRYSIRFIWIAAAAGLFWFLIMVTLTMTDYLTRGVLNF